MRSLLSLTEFGQGFVVGIAFGAAGTLLLLGALYTVLSLFIKDD